MPWNLLTKTTESDRWQSEQHQKQTLHNVLGVVVHWRVVDPETLEESQWGTLKHMALWFWNTQHPETHSAIKHKVPSNTSRDMVQWNTQHPETHSTIKHKVPSNTSRDMVQWNTQHPETHSTIKHKVPSNTSRDMVQWNTQHPETHSAIKHKVPWNTWPSETQSTLKHMAL